MLCANWPASRDRLNMKTILLIPAYNEETNIVATVSKVIDAGYDYVVINDGSSDRTLELCREHDFNVLNLCFNLGIGGAIQAGHKYAYRHGYDIDIQFDGDGQHDVNHVKTLVDAIEDGNDLVIGSRFISEDNQFKSSLLRRVGIRWLGGVLKTFAHVTVTDATSGFRAVNRKAMELFSKDYPDDYPEPESIAVAARRGLKVKEVPVVMYERQGGSSSIAGFSSVYYMIKVTLAVIFASRV